MDMNFAVFQEPRGVMRILHFIFSICAFASVTGYSGQDNIKCKVGDNDTLYTYEYGYPFNLDYSEKCVTISGNFASDAKFFVATGVLAMLYALGIMVVYAKYDSIYKSNNQLPMADFLATVFFGVLWISSSAAWANGLSGLKQVTDSPKFSDACKCTATPSSFSTLNISVVLGFLNFFIWASDIWFVYKETAWFQGNQLQTTSGV